MDNPTVADHADRNFGRCRGGARMPDPQIQSGQRVWLADGSVPGGPRYGRIVSVDPPWGPRRDRTPTQWPWRGMGCGSGAGVTDRRLRGPPGAIVSQEPPTGPFRSRREQPKAHGIVLANLDCVDAVDGDPALLLFMPKCLMVRLLLSSGRVTAPRPPTALHSYPLSQSRNDLSRRSTQAATGLESARLHTRPHGEIVRQR